MAHDSASILYVSSVPAEPTSAGGILLRRHFEAARDRFRVVACLPPVSWMTHWGIQRRIASACGRMWSDQAAEEWHTWIDGRWADKWLSEVKRDRKTVILTIGYGDLSSAAARLAKRAGLPLVVLFHDWWPDVPPLRPPWRARAETTFFGLHRAAAASLPVCDGMKYALGPHPAAETLYPIPSTHELHQQPSSASTAPYPFRVLYAGNLAEYGPMLSSALVESLKCPPIRLEARGLPLQWHPEVIKELQSRKMLLPFVDPFLDREELEAWLQSANALLVTMSFDPSLKRRMMTSFPSKLPEFCRYGRPIIVWGPSYSSAVQWAQTADRGVCITSPDVHCLVDAVRCLADDPKRCAEMGRRAREAYQGMFNPGLLQAQFEEAILRSLRG